MSNELYHFGIKGQKWGVRRFQNPDGSLTDLGKKRASSRDIKRDRDEFSKELNNNTMYGLSDKDRAEYNKLMARAEHLYNKYEFDGDDGGGGRTEADRRAGKEYMDILDKTEKYYDKVRDAREKYVNQKLLAKYGKERIDKFNKTEKIKTGAAVAAVLITAPVTIPVMMVASPVIILGAAGAAAISNKVSNNKTSAATSGPINESPKKPRGATSGPIK